MAESDALRALYQEIILKHHRKPQNRGALENADVTVQMNNPTCGDIVTLEARTTGDRLIEVRFGGHGCSISQASASIMTGLVQDQPFERARELHERFKALVRGETTELDPDLGDARALAGVARFPTRVRCALLAWNALEEAMMKAGGGGEVPTR